jgi:hypothetical protein
MAIWLLEADNDFTKFYFPLEKDKTFFYETVNGYLEESKTVSELWYNLLMVRSEPKKHPDFFELDNTNAIAMSEKALSHIGPGLNKLIELLPIETDAGKYYILNVLNFVDCLNTTKSKYISTDTGTIVSYSLLEFDEKKLGEHNIFKIPQLPYHTFISSYIHDQCEDYHLHGLTFDPQSNLIWYED